MHSVSGRLGVGWFSLICFKSNANQRQREKQGTLPKAFLPNFSIIFWNFGGAGGISFQTLHLLLVVL